MSKITTEQRDRVIGLRVRTARIEMNMSQSELGKTLGVTFQQVQKYEKGTNRVSASCLAEIAATVQKPITYFYDEIKYKPNTRGEQLAAFYGSRLGSQILEAAVDLPVQLQHSLVELARSMRKVAA
jgi:transcriptional regulator with XRE-family HTH domain